MLRQAADLQHRPGQPVHQHGLHRHARTGGHSNLDGRSWRTRTCISKAMPTVANCAKGSPIGSAFTTTDGPIRRSATAPRWRSGTMAAGGAWGCGHDGQRKRCPRAHSLKNSNRQPSLQHDIRRSGRSGFQLRNRSRWSYARGHFNARLVQLTNFMDQVGDPAPWSAGALRFRRLIFARIRRLSDALY